LREGREKIEALSGAYVLCFQGALPGLYRKNLEGYTLKKISF